MAARSYLTIRTWSPDGQIGTDPNKFPQRDNIDIFWRNLIMDKLSLNPPSLVATITTTFQNRRFKLGDPIAYILKASPMTPTGPKKIWTFLKFVQRCRKMAQKWPKMTQNAPKWPKYDPKWPKMVQHGPRMTQNDPKWPKNDPKWPTVAQIWPQMAQNALEWPKMIQSGPKITQNGPKLPQMA